MVFFPLDRFFLREKKLKDGYQSDIMHPGKTLKYIYLKTLAVLIMNASLMNLVRKKPIRIVWITFSLDVRQDNEMHLNAYIIKHLF